MLTITFNHSAKTLSESIGLSTNDLLYIKLLIIFNSMNSKLLVETLFDKDQFDDPKKAELLQELKLCSDKNAGPDDYMHPSCTPRFFNLFPFAESISIENAFIVQIKSNWKNRAK